MKKKFFPLSLILFLASLAACSCGDRQGSTYTTEISGMKLKYDGISNIFRILHYEGNTIVAQVTGGENHLCTYRIDGDTLSLTGSYLHTGRGPGELISPSFYADENGIYCIGNSMAQDYIYRYALHDNILQEVGKEDISWIQPFFSDNFARTGDDKYIVAGGSVGTESILTFVDTAEKTASQLDFWPDDGYSGSKNFGKQIAYCGNASLAANGNKIMYAAPYGRYLDIITVKGEKVVGHNAVYNDFPELIESKNSGFGIIPSSKHNGIKAMATSRRIYAVPLRDSSLERSDGYPSSFNDVIEVFDWEGNLVSRYHTDRPFVMFRASSDDKSLITYGFERPEDTDLSLFVYRLDSDKLR